MVNERKQKLLRMGAILFTLLVSALLCARGATQILASSLLPVQEKPEATRFRRAARAVPEEREPSPQELAQAVLTRNIFDSQTGAMEWDPPVDQTPPSAELPSELVRDPDGEPSLCQGALRLVASFVVPRVPALSFASIEAAGKTMLYRSGMQVDGHDVVGIREHRVFMRPSGRPLCQITMFKPPEVAGQPPAAMAEATAEPMAPPPPGSSGGLSEDELSQGITQVSDTNYTVARSLLDKVLSNQSELMRAARIIPYEENGRVIGVKVYGIRRSSLLGRLGVQNGDVLRTINGFDLSSPDSALEAYTKLREMGQFTIAMVRRGQPRNMDYSVK